MKRIFVTGLSRLPRSAQLARVSARDAMWRGSFEFAAQRGGAAQGLFAGVRQMSSGNQGSSGAQEQWLATMFGALYTRFAVPQPDLHLHQLAMKAGIPVKTVQSMWKRFVEIDVSRNTGDGLTGDRRISSGELDPLLEHAGISDPKLRRALFDAFDADRCGTIDFREFVSGLALLTSDKKQDRTVLIFGLFDLDATRVIHKSEMIDTFKMLISSNQRVAEKYMSGDHSVSDSSRIEVLAEATTEDVFATCDADGNGVLDLDEFRAWLASDCVSAKLVTEWFEHFAGRYTDELIAKDDGSDKEALSHANKEWLSSARARSWHDRAAETGLYSRTDTVLSPGKCKSEP
uniref:EF-hand domain-containing protein n=1 Tax=Hemiselmis andersenii TaxID=464988 RepID=A0A6U2EXQ5_HEMAN|mmetsp:Transcript_29298/g.68454  ORF Transcript_29298/g.68454 Transcript_29298/m.68454 type:complete len:346 (+) Transcript_29298:72-1109(+)